MRKTLLVLCVSPKQSSLVTVAAVARISPRYRVRPLDQDKWTDWLLLFPQQLPPPTPISAVLTVQRQHQWYTLLSTVCGIKYEKILYKSCLLDLERIKFIYINSNGKNCFAFRTIHFSNSLFERIMFDNRGLTILDPI